MVSSRAMKYRLSCVAASAECDCGMSRLRIRTVRDGIEVSNQTIVLHQSIL